MEALLFKQMLKRNQVVLTEENKIKDSGRFYLYRHVRLDTNQVFYIGIGSKRKEICSTTLKLEYARSYQKAQRNKVWTYIVNKTEYVSEILVESDDYVFIKEKEKEFIALYGRKNLGKGTLCNLTDGGDGSVGVLHDPANWEKTVYMYGEDGSFITQFKSTVEAGKKLNINRGIVSSICTGKAAHYKRFRFFYIYFEKVEPLDTTPVYRKSDYIHPSNKKTLKIKDGVVIEALYSTAAFCKKYGYKSSGLSKAVKTGNKAYGFHWKHEETNS